MNKKIIFLLFATIFSLSVMAQGHKNLRITEVMIQSSDTVNAGKATGWVELYNSSYGTYAIEKMFITNKKYDEIFTAANRAEAARLEKIEDDDAVLRYLSANPMKTGVYMVPRGDERNTQVGPHMQVVFNADANIIAGTYHLPFVFTPGQDNYLALYDVNGELVDQVTIPANLPAGQSYALKEEGRLPVADTAFNPDKWEMRDNSSIAKAITPGNFNTRHANENIEKFHKGDPNGLVITVIAMLIVFSALALLFLLFKLFGVVSNKADKKEEEVVAPREEIPAPAVQAQASSCDDEIAAICMALYQHFNAHDEESGVLTFNRDSHTAWNSKSAMMRQLPSRK